MPEIWLSYGPTDVVLDIKAENLETQVEPRGTNLTDSEITSKLADVDVTKPAELVIMEYTKSTRLLRRFGKENMLEAYEKRNGNLPLPGEELKTMQVAKRFTEDFEISAIEIVANQTGIIDISTGHPSSTVSVSKSLSSTA